MYQKYLKRTFDTTLAFIVLMVAMPLGILIAMLIRIDSKGPVVFKQKRTGLHGSVFNMYKFRTMLADNNVNDADQANQLTTLGKIIRALSLDEIPQFVNIIKGEMSVIGPRPWIPEYYQHMTDEQRKRTIVKPGITGLAQARGRNNLNVFDKINFDLLYIKEVSFVNDVKIIVYTIQSLFEKTGCYIEKYGIHQEIQTLRLQLTTPVSAAGAFYSELPKQNITSNRVRRNSNRKISQDKDSLVSIIIPVYNASIFLDETIKTIQNQTYTNWEAIFIDDCSTDNSEEIIKKYRIKDERIKLYKNETNSYAAITRNKGIDESLGRYIAFLDADDLWVPCKLEKQIAFMLQRDCAFSFTSYEFADENGNPNGKKVHVPNSLSYIQALKNTIIWTSTVMFDMREFSKEQIYMPDVKSEDTACWWKVLKNINHAYGLDEVLSFYRRTNSSLSSDKKEAVRRTWNLYRNVENLGFSKSAYYFGNYAYKATRKRV
jgi:teichuronic acid biosynthesis glycosyltransferase TuaG